MSETIEIKDIPQANSLRTVYLTVLAVSRGAKKSQEIAEFIGMSDRQGRYYRRAAEVLCFIESVGKNNSELTELGKNLLIETNYNPDKVAMLKPYVLEIPIVSEVLEKFENDEYLTEEEVLKEFLKVAGVKSDNVTAKRRLSTFVSWMKDIGVFSNELEEVQKVSTTAYRISKQVKETIKPSVKLVKNYDDFVSNINIHIKVPYESIIGKVEEKALQELMNVSSIPEMKSWLKLEGAEKLARLICFISEKEEIDIEKLYSETNYFKSVELSYGRLLIESDRALRGLSSNISKGGNALETLLSDYCKKHDLKYYKDHLFEGISKNVDFYIPELNLAIECKYTKTSGTKHGGALKDLREQSKGKRKFNYKLGVMVAGEQYLKDEEFQKSIFKLKEDGILEYVFTPKDLELKPEKLKNVVRAKLASEEVELKVLDETSWSETLTDVEYGLDDASRWLERFMSLDFLNFKSQLYTWVMQTPFAVQTLRLIMGWSESKMSAFLKTTISDSAWKENVDNFKDVSIIIDLINENLTAEEVKEIQDFYAKPISLMDFLVCRESALRGSAVRKKNTSKYFIEYCKEIVTAKVIDETETLELPSGSKVKSNFKIEVDGKIKNVLCKYYASSGSVMSDLVKTIAGISELHKGDEWIFIVDGSGWLARTKDLNRMISLVQENELDLYTLATWQASKQAS